MTSMQRLLRWMDRLSQRVLGTSILYLYRKVEQSKLRVQQAETFAQQRQFIQAVVAGQEVLSQWDAATSWREKQFRRWLMQRSLHQLRQQMLNWMPLAKLDYQTALERSRKLAIEGRFQDAINLLEPIHDRFSQADGRTLLEKLHQLCERDYQTVLMRSRKLATEGRFQDAIKVLEPIQQQFPQPNGTAWLERLHRLGVPDYQTALKRSHRLAAEGRFQDAIDLLEPIHLQFPQSNGTEFLATLRRIDARDYQTALERSHTLATEGRFQDAINLFEPIHQQFPQPDGTEWLQSLYQLRDRDCRTVLLQSHTLATEGRFQAAIDLFEPIHQQFPQPDGTEWLETLHRFGVPDYQTALERSHTLATEGRFQDAIEVLKPIHLQFPQPNGIVWLDTLHQIVEARKSFHLGLRAEKAADWRIAKHCYQQAMTLSPYWKTECQIRLAWVAIKTAQWSEALSCLEQIQTEQAAALREICHIQPDPKQPVIQEPPSNAYPRLEVEVWQRCDWQEIVNVTEACWLTHRNILTLHNWAIATYYRSLNTGEHWDDCIVALSTALVNLHQDPTLRAISWKSDQPIALSEVYAQFKQHLEELVSGLEKTNPTAWSQIRLLHRLETTSLGLIGQPPTTGLRVEELFLTPGCYQRFRHQLNVPLLPSGYLWTLYTDWWQAILACIDGNTFQAVQLRPQRETTSEVEKLAQAFVSYYEGMYYLQPQADGSIRWRTAMAPLRQAKPAIQAFPNWFKEIDQWFESYTLTISHTRDYIELIRFWHELLKSTRSTHYLRRLAR